MSERRRLYDSALAHPQFKTERHRRCLGLIECLCWKLFSDCGVHKKAYIKEEKSNHDGCYIKPPMTVLIHAPPLKQNGVISNAVAMGG